MTYHKYYLGGNSNMNYNLVLLKAKSSKSGNEFVSLCVDMGYKKYYLSCDKSVIAEILNVTVVNLLSLIDNLKLNECLKVGSVNVNLIK